ncbi:hypothetical protein FA95DRAFT_167280 [Auriscalpium vulgare]|uniref:Uncharacterized protein n=1 Tax=Auriscalpium vulgare TaxID=40419 RepID=A0ACB8RMJ7_9AGAM|nr:hypothetical protein FA95DRAFT_167280 [Auriscalpium vulgare]
MMGKSLQVNTDCRDIRFCYWSGLVVCHYRGPDMIYDRPISSTDESHIVPPVQAFSQGLSSLSYPILPATDTNPGEDRPLFACIRSPLSTALLLQRIDLIPPVRIFACLMAPTLRPRPPRPSASFNLKTSSRKKKNTPIVPLEVQHEILKSLYRKSQAHVIDYATLRACALVCKAWAVLAQSLLFRRAPRIPPGAVSRGRCTLVVGAPPPRLPRCFVRVLRKSPHLGMYVRALTLDISVDLSPALEPRGHGAAQAWAAVLELCPRVEKLTFAGPWSSEQYASFGAQQQQVRLRVLDFERARPSEKDVRALLGVWPDVRWLTVDTPGITVAQMGVVGIEMKQHTITHVDGGVLDGADTILRTLVVRAWPQSWEIKAPALAPRITSLTVGTLPSTRILQCFTALEELIFSGVKSAFAPPAALRHLGYHAKEWSHRPLSSYAVGRAVSELQNLQLVTTTLAWDQELQDELREACRVRDVEFVVYPDAESFPREKNVEWV